MTEFTVHVANRPGVLAALTEQLSSAGINIEALAAFGVDRDAQVRLIVDDAMTTRSILDRADIRFEEREVLITLLDPEPGSVAGIARRLAEAEVNIDAMYLLRSSAQGWEFAIAVDEPERARTRLGA
jgi:hypothetical protein